MRIKWTVVDGAFVFSMKVEDAAPSPEAWANQPNQSDFERAAVAVLHGLMESELAEAEAGGLRVPFAEIASLESVDVIRLGLPGAAPWTVRLEGQGLVTDPDFRVLCSLVWPETQRPVLGVTRQGPIVEVGGERYTLLDPQFSILEKVETINKFSGSEGVTNEDRLMAWGELREILPEQAVVDGMLAELDVVRADAFSLSPFLAEDGSVDFDVVPMIASRRSTAESEEDPGPREIVTSPAPSLSEADLEDFQQRFRRRQNVVRSIPLSSRTVLVLSPNAHRAVQVARNLQRDGSRDEKRAFIGQPYAVLREQLPDFSDEEIDGLFVETADFGERVRGIALWQPVALPFLAASGIEWLPMEEVGFSFEPSDLGRSLEEIAALEERVRQAISDGEATIEVSGRRLPANEETLSAIEDARRRIEQKAARERDPASQATHEESEGITALVIDDNIEEGLYRRPLTPRQGDVDLPTGVRTKLLPHQRSGLEWLQRHWLDGTPGAILADDMGLGKTLQSLAFLGWVRNQGRFHGERRRPFLIVAPSGLLKNWSDEAEKHLDARALGIPCEAHGRGLRALRDSRVGVAGGELDGPHGLPVLDTDRLSRQTWVLTTYETVRDYQFSFARVPWAVVIFDEAQKIKNPSALMTVAAKAVNADFTIAMTGTPVENRVADLWCIADTAQPGRLGVLADFVRSYDDTDFEGLRELGRVLVEADTMGPPFILRRMKEDHLDGLPSKHEVTFNDQMPSAQAEAYSRAVDEARQARGNKGAMLRAIQRLRSISLHPGVDGGAASDEMIISKSARLRRTIEILDDVRARSQKALVFVEALDLQPVLAAILQRRYDLPSLPLIINGSVNGDTRKRRVDQFQGRRGFDVMLLSPKAGGVGLTLTAANHVIHLSRWWNPAVENQSTDRVYRIGQDKPVTVYIPRAVHPEFGERSFDVQLHALLEKKKALFRGLLMPSVMTESDYEGLFNTAVGD